MMTMPFAILKSSQRPKTPSLPLVSNFAVDVHAHVLPGLDNGPTTLEESISLLRTMSAQGVRKVIATPHIMGDFYRNSIEAIEIAKFKVDRELRKKSDKIVVDIAAEYYVDVAFMGMLENNEPLLTINKQYILLETAVVNLPAFFWECIGILTKKGLKPVLAHPERYNFLQQNFELMQEIHRRGVLFQVSLSSMISPYEPAKKAAEWLVNEGMASFLGSNVHHLREWGTIKEALNTKVCHTAFEKGLLNNSLL